MTKGWKKAIKETIAKWEKIASGATKKAIPCPLCEYKHTQEIQDCASCPADAICGEKGSNHQNWLADGALEDAKLVLQDLKKLF